MMLVSILGIRVGWETAKVRGGESRNISNLWIIITFFSPFARQALPLVYARSNGKF